MEGLEDHKLHVKIDIQKRITITTLWVNVLDSFTTSTDQHVLTCWSIDWSSKWSYHIIQIQACDMRLKVCLKQHVCPISCCILYPTHRMECVLKTCDCQKPYNPQKAYRIKAKYASKLVWTQWQHSPSSGIMTTL